MGIFDKAKDALSDGQLVEKAKDLINEHEGEVDKAIDKAADAIDQHTGDKFAGAVGKAQQFAKDKTGSL